jgi:pyruvate-formate lyase-activating enzyme
MVVNTLLILTFVDEQEILAIARFIAGYGPMDLEYRINPFRAELSPVAMSRTSSYGELEAVATAARAFYHNTVSSRNCLKESESGRSTAWITVFPDGEVERRG